jgi:molecular chaperone HscB
MPKRLNLDTGALEQKYRELSRQFHPDYFYSAPSSERLASLERSSYLNDAYRTLKDPIARIEYLLELEGLGVGSAARTGIAQRSDTTVPPSLLEEVFTLNEELDAVRELRAGGAPENEWQRRLNVAREPIDAKRIEHEATLNTLASEWDAVADLGPADNRRRAVLTALREQMLERNYINNLLAGIERELAP